MTIIVGNMEISGAEVDQTAGTLTVPLSEFTTNERHHRYALGDVRVEFGLLFAACTIIRGTRCCGLFPDDYITWARISSEDAIATMKMSERRRYDGGYYY